MIKLAIKLATWNVQHCIPYNMCVVVAVSAIRSEEWRRNERKKRIETKAWHSFTRSFARSRSEANPRSEQHSFLSLSLLLFSRQSAATKNKTKPKKDKSCAFRKRQGEEKDKDKDKEGAEAEDILLAARLRVAQSDRPTGRLNLRGQQTNKQANDSDNDTRTASSPPSKYKYTLTHTTRV